ncbi:MAG: YceI family protein [Candidatus Omnitrophica bacterium]|nr:YceI family protein [Candidatus Omnitrophota bacterium]
MHVITRSILVVCLVSFPSMALAAEYSFDQSSSEIVFFLRHLKAIPAEGSFKEFSGSFNFDLQTIEDSNAKLVIDADSLDSSNPLRDAQLRSRRYFWTSKYPSISFVSTAFGNLHGSRFLIYGELTIKDRTQAVVFDTEILTPIAEISPEKPLRFRTEASIRRSDFDLGGERWYDPISSLTGETLKIRLEVGGTPTAQNHPTGSNPEI